MRNIRTLGLLVATATAMALFGPPSAMAENTALCVVDQEPCSVANQVKEVHLVSTKANTNLLNLTLNVSCIALFSGTVAGALLANPLKIAGKFSYSSCTFGCAVTEASASSTLQVLRTANEVGVVTGEGKVHVNCFGFLDCVYGYAGLSGSGTGGLSHASTEFFHITFANAPMTVSGDPNCTHVTLDTLFESLTKEYLKS